MASKLQKFNAKKFISIVIEIIGESMNSGMPNNQEINNLLAQASSKVEGEQCFSDLFKQLASTVKKDEKTFAMIAEKLDAAYQSRIRVALENKLQDFDDEDEDF